MTWPPPDPASAATLRLPQPPSLRTHGSGPPGTSPAPPPVVHGRLHPAAIVLGPAKQLTGLLAVIVGGALAPGLGLQVGVLVVLAGAAVAGGFVRWWRFSYALSATEIVLESGLLNRTRRVLPLDRLQSVDLARPLLHRLCGVVELRLEVVGGTGIEGRLDALPPAEAQWLRGRLLGRDAGDAGTPEVPAGEVLVTTTPGRLVVAGLTGGRVSVAAALAGVAFQLGGDRVQGALEGLPARGLAVAAGLAVLVVLVVFAISVIATVVGLWGFRLERRGSSLVVRRGLLEQRLDTIPLRRVQAVLVEENLPRRVLGLATVRLIVAGREGRDQQDSAVVAMPLDRRARAHLLAADLIGLPASATGSTGSHAGRVPAGPVLTPAPGVARVPRLVPALVLPALLAAVVAGLAGPWGWGLAGLVVATVPWALDAWRNLGSARLPTHLVTRSGSALRRTTTVPLARLQIVTHRQGPLQRALHLADVELQIPRSAASGAPTLIDLPAGPAAALVADLSRLA